MQAAPPRTQRADHPTHANIAASFQGSLWGTAPLAAGQLTQPWQALDAHSSILHEPGWLRGADDAFDIVSNEVSWRHGRRTMYDRVVDVPRLTAQIRPRHAAAMFAEMPVTQQILVLAGQSVHIDNFVHIGLNLYRDGSDSVAWHRDRIGRHRDHSLILLVSLGGTRTLRLRRFQPETGGSRGPSHAFTLHSGDLFVMAGACQRDWEHQVPKTQRAAPRISIALRACPEGPRSGPRGVPPLM